MQDFHFLPFGSQENSEPVIQVNYTNSYLNYGSSNSFPEELIALSGKSSTHQSILELKTSLTAGEGWLLPTGRELPTFIDQMLLRQIANDLTLFHGFALQIVWAKNGKNIASIHCIPFQHIRCGIPNGLGQVKEFYYSLNWNLWETSKATQASPKMLLAFNPEESRSNPRQLLYFARYHSKTMPYPMPTYLAAQGDILFENEYQKYKLASIKNGMFPGLHIEVEGLPTEEERNEFYKAVEKKFTGPQQAGRVLVTYGLDQAGRTKVSPIPQQAGSDLFLTWAEDARQRIITAHRLSSPVLAGIPRSGGLGNSSSEISTAFEHFYNAVIREMQCEILQAMAQLQPFLEHDITGLDISNVKPLRFVFSEAILAQVLTTDELRQELGYPPINSPT